MKVKNDHRSKFSNLSNWKEEAWKKSGLQRDSNPWPPRYRCVALPTELWSHTLGARSIEFISPVRSEIMWSIYEIIHFWTAVVAERWFNWEVQSGGGRKFSDILYSVFNLVPRLLFPPHLQSQGKAPYYLFFNRELYVAINHLLADSVTIYVFYMIIYDCVVYMPLGGGGGGVIYKMVGISDFTSWSLWKGRQICLFSM